MSSKTLILTLSIIMMGFSPAICKLAYVICPDGKSACDDYKICCQKNSGYSCCPASLCCCNEGSYCCTCTSFLGANLLLKHASVPSKALEHIPTEAFTPIQIKNSTVVSTYEEESNAILGAYLAFDNFLNVTGYYKYSRNAFGCKSEFALIVQNSIKEISILNNKTLVDNPIEFLSKFTATMAEIFYHARQLISDCKSVPEEFKNVLDLVSTYITTPDPKTGQNYFFKFFENLEGKVFSIFAYFGEVTKLWNDAKYAECGETLGELFNTLFEI